MLINLPLLVELAWLCAIMGVRMRTDQSRSKSGENRIRVVVLTAANGRWTSPAELGWLQQIPSCAGGPVEAYLERAVELARASLLPNGRSKSPLQRAGSEGCRRHNGLPDGAAFGCAEGRPLP